MPDDFGVIKPRAVPLSHTGGEQPAGPTGSTGHRWLLLLILLGAIAAIAALFIAAPNWVEPLEIVSPQPTPSNAAPPPSAAPRPSPDDQPPPFQALRREQARTEAGGELARFVELELKLREELKVGAWAEAPYDAARTLAQAGDEAFVAERFDSAIDQYRQAADALAALIDEGHALFENALTQGLASIDERDPTAAETWLSEAGEIKPDSPALASARQRAGHLPEIITKFRAARNHELAGRWDQALRTYQAIRALDADTPGLGEAIAAARRGRSEQALRERLSTGFKALEQGHFEQAERSFQQALKIDPGNASAEGGLQQIADQSELVTIAELRAEAERHAAAERWAHAAQANRRILALDANIQFAREGLRQAEAQSQALSTLERITAGAERLSSDTLYQEAQDILANAKSLSPRGSVLAAAIERMDAVLRHHGTPVPVLLRSDDATEVLLSNVGPLGRFSEKRLELRPGAYTLIGSRDGCRDVRTEINVEPRMAPVEIRCLEVLQR